MRHDLTPEGQDGPYLHAKTYCQGCRHLRAVTVPDDPDAFGRERRRLSCEGPGTPLGGRFIGSTFGGGEPTAPTPDWCPYDVGWVLGNIKIAGLPLKPGCRTERF